LLALHLRQVVQGTFTPELLSMLGTRRGGVYRRPRKRAHYRAFRARINRAPTCAEHAQQLRGESPLHNLTEVKC